MARRLTAAALVVAAGVVALSPADARQGQQVVALTGDLPVGARLAAGELQVVRVEQIPDGAISDPAQALGRELAGRARRGEIVTDARLADSVGPDPGAGRVAVPVRPADPAMVGLLGPGMHVAVISVSEGGATTALATDAVVLVVADQPARGSTDRPVVLSVPADSADQIVAAALAGTIALRFT